ncbi:MAG: aspartate-semialdehyde dehydrogenase [Legionellales bacterium]|nr:aspartate-semialdehyde dehydrogenase [Legionellales bacterium]|tara:strand:+ start:1507 stop:2529 length:1023 start_codon:yes stop_codon:yes gene_type:complete
MSKLFNVAVLGATGLVGQTAIKILESRKFPVKQLFPLASERSSGKTIQFAEQAISVENVDTFDFSQVEIAIFSAGAVISEKFAPIAAAAGCIVIDNTTAFRNDPDVPLVVPEVNAEAIALYCNKNIIANPNCSTIQLVVALKPIYDAVGIKRVEFSSYQSVSGAGKEGIAELMQQTAEYLAEEVMSPEVFSAPIAFNLIPAIDDFLENGFTKEEMKVVNETHKIFADTKIEVNPTAVRVPVIFGHSEAISIETKQPLTVKEARALFDKMSGITVLDEPENLNFPTPMLQGAGTDDVYIGRIRQDLYHNNRLNFWVVADNVRKGAALNAVQIAEKLITQIR